MPPKKAWLTIPIERSLRTEIRKTALSTGMKMGPLIEGLIKDGLLYRADRETERLQGEIISKFNASQEMKG